MPPCSSWWTGRRKPPNGYPRLSAGGWSIAWRARDAGNRRARDGFVAVLLDVQTWAYSFIYFTAAAGIYALYFFLPTVVKAFGISDIRTGLLVALPSVCSAIGMLLLGYGSDRTLRRRAYLCVAHLVVAAGFVATGLCTGPTAIMAALCFAGFGLLAAVSLFWPLPSATLPSDQAPAGLAVINAFGNLSGFFGPYAFGLIKDTTGGFSAGFLALGGSLIVSALVALTLPKRPERTVDRTEMDDRMVSA